MQQRLSTLSFPDWLQFVFDHTGEGPEWYWDDDAPYWNAPPAVTADYVTRHRCRPWHPTATPS